MSTMDTLAYPAILVKNFSEKTVICGSMKTKNTSLREVFLLFRVKSFFSFIETYGRDYKPRPAL